MRKYFNLLSVLVVFGLSTASAENQSTTLAAANGQTPSEASALVIIEEMGVLAVLEQFMGQTETIVTRTVTEKAAAVGGLNPEQIGVYEEMGQQMAEVYQETIAWDVIKPAVIEIFQQNFTAEEVEGISAFYQTPAGIALNEKMPIAIGETMQLFESLVVGMTPKIQELEARAKARVDELQADSKDKTSDLSE